MKLLAVKLYQAVSMGVTNENWLHVQPEKSGKGYYPEMTITWDKTDNVIVIKAPVLKDHVKIVPMTNVTQMSVDPKDI